MKYKLSFSFIFLVFISLLHAQTDLSERTSFVNGFAEKVSGVDFRYHSSIQIAKESMLIRATDGQSSMEWRTAPVPAKIKTDSVSFVWLAGIGSSPGLASFDLEVNGNKKFTFWANGSNQWSMTATDGSTLKFKKDMIDQHGDRFGFMVLTMPAKALEKGKPLTLKMTGGKFDKTSWYMTFAFPLTNGVQLKAFPAMISDGKKKYQLGIAGILHFGKPGKAGLYLADHLITETTLKYGYNHVNVKLPVTDIKKTLPYKLKVADKTYSGNIELMPVKKWRVNFVQHSHTDIGYTRSQTEIMGDHLRFIDYALDYCDQTDDYPDAAKFRWTCEASWAVDEYIKSRPEAQIQRLLKRIKEHRIEITGMYFNFDELPDEQTITASLRPFKTFRELGIEIKTAMQNDVNGIAWCLADYYQDLGVKYLNMGTHGHRALICFDKPTLFWWESPSGNRMLAYRGEHYMIGNTEFKVQSGDFNVFEESLLTYLMELEQKGYKYDLISLQHSGFITDNSPPSTFMSQAINMWNEKYEWPKLRTASATSFFETMEKEYGHEFPVIRGAWPDWWTDGFGASAREVAAIRNAQGILTAAGSGMVMATMQWSVLPEKITDRLEQALEAMLFYTEHTVGFHASVREPFHKYSMEQRGLKESYAWEASRRARMLSEETLGMLQDHIEKSEEPTLVVFNTLNWPRSGLLKVYIDHQTIPRYTRFFIEDKDGRELKAQPVERHSDGTYWAIWVDDIPAFGFRKYRISVFPEQNYQENAPLAHPSNIFENPWYKIELDYEKGALTNIFDKEMQTELTDKNATWLFGQFIYELLDNRQQMESFYLNNYTRNAPSKIWLESYTEGEVWNTIRFRADTPAANSSGSLVFEIRIFNTEKRIDFHWDIDKKLVTDPEGIYLAFPLQLKDGQLAFDVQGGEIRAGVDQIPGSSNDWNTVQHYARLYNDQTQVIISSSDAPLMQFGGINTGRYKAGATPQSTHIYGWPMNNYWTTNFNGYQFGGHSWLYSFTSLPGNDKMDAAKFGHGNKTPFLSRVIPGGGKGEDRAGGSLITGWPEHVILINALPEQDGNSAVLNLREISGKSAEIELKNGINGKMLKLEQVDATGAALKNTSLVIPPFGNAFYRIYF